jgi:transcriptional regulator CtsR
MRQLVYQDMQEKIDEETEFSVVQSMIAYLLKHQMITNREAALLLTTAQTAYEAMEPEDRVQLLRTLFMTLERLS